MRLIDADALSGAIFCEADMTNQFTYHNSVQQIINGAPTIDAVEVVRCKDCKWYCVIDASEEYYHAYCEIINIRGKLPPDPMPNDYCNYGERKDNGRTDKEE